MPELVYVIIGLIIFGSTIMGLLLYRARQHTRLNNDLYYQQRKEMEQKSKDWANNWRVDITTQREKESKWEEA